MSFVNIPYKSPKHSKLLQQIIGRWRYSRDKMGDYSQVWSDAEDDAFAYIHETQVDAIRREARRQGFVDYTTIDVPLSYAMLMSAHTYWSNIFLNRDPILELTARHGEGMQNVMAAEALLDYQLQVGEGMVPLYIWLYDAGKYGRGILGSYWDEESDVVGQIEEIPETIQGIPTGKTRKVYKTIEVPGYIGNRIYNIRPQDFFPDPRVTLANLQKGEFVGVYNEISWNEVLRREHRGDYFNVKELNDWRMNNLDRDMGSPRMDIPSNVNPLSFGMIGKDFVPLIEMYVDLIPSDWDLGSGSRPQKWVFTVANEAVIIGARPLGYYHNRFPFHTLEYEIEGYNIAKRSIMQISKPLKDVATWLVNSHFYNVRKSQNDQFIIDQTKVNMADMTDPNPGKLIRLKAGATGTDVRTVIQQLPVADVTQNNIKDMALVADMLQRITGINDNIQSVVNEGGRKTAQEIRSSNTFGISRLKTNAEYMSAMGWAPFTQTILQTTQQMYDMQREYKITRDIMQGQSFINVSPGDIRGFYDFVPVDGTLPVDKYAMAAQWTQFLAQARNFPGLLQGYDLTKLFAYIAQLSGLKNINQFKVNIVPDGSMNGQVQQGNVVPIPTGGNNGNPVPPTAGASGTPPTPPAPYTG